MGQNLDIFTQDLDDILAGKEPKKRKVQPLVQPSSALDVPKIVDDELSKLGWTPNARLAMVANVGRENSWNPSVIFAGHDDPANNEYNRGIISWQKDRRTALDNFLKRNGGDYTPSEKNLRLMTRFLDDEMQNANDARVGTWRKVNQKMKDPNLSLDEAYPLLQKYILYQPQFESDNKNWEKKARNLGFGKGQFDSEAEFNKFLAGLDGIVPANPIGDFTKGLDNAAQTEPVNPLNDFTKGLDEIVPVAQPTPAINVKPVQEADFTITEQAKSALNPQSPRSAVLLTEPTQKGNPLFLDKNFVRVETPNGSLFVNKNKVQNLGLTTPELIDNYVKKNGFASLIGKVEDVGNQTADGMAVRTETPDGKELSTSVVTNPVTAEQQAENDKLEFGDKVNQEVLPTTEAVAKRANDIAGYPMGAGGQTQLKSDVLEGYLEPLNEAKSSNQIDENEYKKYLVYTKKQDSPQVKAEFAALVQNNPEVQAQVSFEAGSPLERPQPNQQQPQIPVAREVKTQNFIQVKPNQLLQGAAGTFEIDLSKKPKGVNTGQYELRVALEKLAPKYGLTGDDIKNGIEYWKRLTGGYTKRDGMTDEEIAANPIVQFSVTNDFVNTVLKLKRGKQDDGTIEPDFEADINLAANVSPQGLQKSQDESQIERENTELESERYKAREQLTDTLIPSESPTEEQITAQVESNRRARLDADTREQAEADAQWLRENLGETGANIVGGLMGGAARVNRAVGGILRASGIDSGYELFSRIAEKSETLDKNTGDSSISSQLVKGLSGAPFDLSRLFLLSRLPGGAVTAFTLDNAWQAQGRGESGLKTTQEAIKGAALGTLFGASGRLASAVESTLTKQGVRLADKLPAGALQDSAYKASRLVAMAAGEGTRIGAIGTGTYSIEKIAGASDEEAFNSAAVMTLFDLLMKHGGKASDLAGRVFRVWKNGRKMDVTVDQTGAVKALNGEVAPSFIDGEIVVDPKNPKYAEYEQKFNESKNVTPKTDAVSKSETKTEPFNSLDRNGELSRYKQKLLGEAPKAKPEEIVSKLTDSNTSEVFSELQDAGLSATEAGKMIDARKEEISAQVKNENSLEQKGVSAKVESEILPEQKVESAEQRPTTVKERDTAQQLNEFAQPQTKGEVVKREPFDLEGNEFSSPKVEFNKEAYRQQLEQKYGKPYHNPLPEKAIQPFEITQREFVNAERNTWNPITKNTFVLSKDDLIEEHKESIKNALENGVQVPAEVLADYPDLANKYQAQTKEAKEQISPATTNTAASAPVKLAERENVAKELDEFALPKEKGELVKKEPYELTKNDYLQNIADKYRQEQLSSIEEDLKQGNYNKNLFTPETYRRQVEARFADTSPSNIIDAASFERRHKKAVEQALKEGKEVSKDVLADYPALAREYGIKIPVKRGELQQKFFDSKGLTDEQIENLTPKEQEKLQKEFEKFREAENKPLTATERARARRESGEMSDVGEHGQISHYLRRNGFANDVFETVTGEKSQLKEDSPYSDKQAEMNAALDSIAESVGKTRSSEMSPQDWQAWLENNADTLPLETTTKVLDALTQNEDFNKRKSAFVEDVADIIDNIDLDNLKEYRALPLKTRREILSIGRKYGLTDQKIKEAFDRSLSRYIQGRTAERGLRAESEENKAQSKNQKENSEPQAEKYGTEERLPARSELLDKPQNLDRPLYSKASRNIPDILQKEFPSLKQNVTENDNIINLGLVVVSQAQRGQGIGSDFMNRLTELADKAGKIITLSPTTEFGGTSKERLRRFYKNFGFVENKGRNKAYTISEEMYRLPKSYDRPLYALSTPPVFYSQLEKTIESKMPARASAAQVKGLLKPEYGIKKEELDWLGIEQFLESKPVFTKAEVLDFIRENNVKVEEVVKEQKGNRLAHAELYANGDELSDTLNTIGASEHFNVLNESARIGESFENALENEGIDVDEFGGYYDEVETQYNHLVEAYKRADDENFQVDTTKFSQYTLPNGENYKELLLTMPPKTGSYVVKELPHDGGFQLVTPDGSARFPSIFNTRAEAEAAIPFAGENGKTARTSENYKSSHFDEPNILVHIRFDERVDSNGKKTLHIAEIQSDAHQEARKKGYKGQLPKDWVVEKEANGLFTVRDEQGYSQAAAKTKQEAIEALDRQRNAVPNLPFKKSWAELGLKRALRYAVENDFDAVSWDTGEIQAERYDLSKYINRVEYAETDGILAAFDKSDKRVIREQGVKPEKLEDYIGKEAAAKLMEQPKEFDGFRYLEGQELKVGGEGMKGFYDKILPQFAQKYVKKWNAKVGTSEIQSSENKDWTSTYDKAKAREAFDRGDKIRGQKQYDNEGKIIESREEIDDYHLFTFKAQPTAVHSIEITPSMRESVSEGQPLFNLSPSDQKKADSITKEARAVRGASVEDLIEKAEIKSVGNLIFTNAEATELLRQAHIETFGDADLDVFYGAYLKPAHAQIVSDKLFFNVLKTNNFDNFALRQRGRKFFADFRKAIDEKYGDLRHVVAGKNAPRGLRAAVQEETAHQADSRVGMEGEISAQIFPKDRIARKAMNYLSKNAYKGASNSLLAKEVGAKIWRDDAEQELKLNAGEIEHLQNLIFDAYIDNGVTPDRLEAEFSKIDEATKEYDEQYRQSIERNTRNGEQAETAGTSENGGQISTAIRRAGSGRNFTVAEKDADGKRKELDFFSRLQPKDQSYLEKRFTGADLERASTEVALARDESFETQLERELQSIKPERNSKGELLAPNGRVSNIQNERLWKTIRTRAFLDFFGDWVNNPKEASKVVDENGEPLIVYHGTKEKNLEVFDKSKQGTNTKFGESAAFFFTSDREYAEEYANRNFGKDVTAKYFKALETNPNANFDDFQFSNAPNRGVIETFLNVRNPAYGNSGWTGAKKIFENAQKEGFDGVFGNQTYNKKGEFGEIAVFEPNQIKSIFNRGTFSPDNDSILYSRPKTDTKTDLILDVISSVKSLKATADLSAAGRQGWILSLTHPKTAFRSFAKQLRVVFSKEYFEKFKQNLNLHPYIELAEESGLFLANLADKTDLNEREEAFLSRIFGDDPYFKKNGLESVRRFITFPVRKAEHAYTTYLDNLRIECFTLFAKQVGQKLKRQGITDNGKFKDEMEGIARFVNYATGRGDWGSPTLNATFFSTRYWESRLQLLNPVFYGKLPPKARRLALKNMAGFVGATTLLMLLWKLAGGEIEYDNPDNPDALKLKSGNYSYDISAGMVSHLRFIARMAKATQSEKPTDDMAYLGGRYLRSKLAPVPSGAWSALEGKNYIGEPTSWKEEALALPVPISITNFVEAAKEDGSLGLIKMFPEFVGFGVTRYKQPKEIKEEIQKEKVKLQSAKTPKDKLEAARRIKLWGKLLERSLKAEAEKSKK